MKLSMLVLLAGTAIATAGPASAASYRVLYRFGQSAVDGTDPIYPMVNVGGTLYGTTITGGTGTSCSQIYSCGTIFALNPVTGTETVAYSFQPGSGGWEPGALLNVGGTLYSVTLAGGVADIGTVVSFNPATGVEALLYSFSYTNNNTTPTPYLISFNGLLYGTTSSAGEIFTVDPATGAETIPYQFPSRGQTQIKKHGNVPTSPLLAVGNTLYGSTDHSYGTYNGAVFKFTPQSGTEEVIHLFRSDEPGATPSEGLIQAGKLLYGVTSFLKDGNGGGIVFSVNPKNGKEAAIYKFKGGADGWVPSGNLLDVDGILYGTTGAGGGGPCGNIGCGTVFSLNLSTGVEKVVYAFQGGSDGESPASGLINVGGTLYGTTRFGGGTGCGGSGCGTAFAITP
jgi:uncharacterized repeat protein (TIGR03803 family)